MLSLTRAHLGFLKKEKKIAIDCPFFFFCKDFFSGTAVFLLARSSVQCDNELFSSCVAFVKKNERSTPFLSPNDAAQSVFYLTPPPPCFLSSRLPRAIWHFSTFHRGVHSESA